MLRGLIPTNRLDGASVPVAAKQARSRPAVELLECRLAPSMTPISAPLFTVITQPVKLAPAQMARLDLDVTPTAQPDLPAESRPAQCNTGIASTITDEADSQAPGTLADRAEFFASTVAATEVAQYDAVHSAPESAAQPPQASAQGGLPLLAWVVGMTCLLMLRWERRLGGPKLSPATSGWARCRRRLAELAMNFRQLKALPARSASV